MKLPALSSLTTIIKNLRYGDTIHSARDWIIVVALFLVGIFVSVIWSTVFFLDVVNREAAASSIAETPLDTEKLTEVRNAFEGRVEEADRYRSEYRFIDPSL